MARTLGLCTLPKRVTWSGITVLGLVAGIGFTMASFIAGLAFSGSPYLAAAKLRVLTASTAVAALILGRLVLREPGGHEAPDVSPGEAEASTER